MQIELVDITPWLMLVAYGGLTCFCVWMIVFLIKAKIMAKMLMAPWFLVTPLAATRFVYFFLVSFDRLSPSPLWREVFRYVDLCNAAAYIWLGTVIIKQMTITINQRKVLIPILTGQDDE